MTGEIALMLSTVSGLASLAIGIYVFSKNPRRLVNILFLFMAVFLAIWAFSDAMTMAASELSDKIFWTRFQGIGELFLIPTYLLIALYFPEKKRFIQDRRKAAAIITTLYAPFLLGLILLYGSDLIYSAYLPADNVHGMAVVRTPLFWVMTALGFGVIMASAAIYLWQRRGSTSKAARRGLLILALAPAPMLIVNIIQNFEINPNITTPQAAFIFLAMLAYGIMQYGLFLDFRSVAKGIFVHTAVIAINMAVITLLCAFYYFGLDLQQGPLLYAMLILTGIPFMFAYHAEVEWAGRMVNRYFYGREFEESRLLQDLSYSIRTVRNVKELADDVVTKVRGSMDLSFCSLMLREEDRYRLIGYSYHPGHLSREFQGAVEEGLFSMVWERGISFDCESGRFSCYWEVGNSIDRGECTLDYLHLGIMRIYDGDGAVKEMLWREEVEGEAISVPLEVGGEEVGLLWLGGKMSGDSLSIQELDFIVAHSTQVAVSLQNSLLLQELLDKSDRLQDLIQSATSAQEEERIRISRELHDGLAPYFLDIIFKVERLQDEINRYPSIALSLNEVRGKAREGLRDLRQVITDLRPSSLDVLGLEKSLAAYLERFGVENDMEVEFRTWGGSVDLDSLVEVTMFRVAQEALSNIARHAGAGKVTVSLGNENGYLEMIVEDDGVGFVEREAREKMILGESLGIKGMRERAELMQGDFAIDSRPGIGTRIRFSVPVGRV